MDLYALAVAVPKNYSRVAASSAGDNGRTAMKSIVVYLSAYDWENDALTYSTRESLPFFRLRHPVSDASAYPPATRSASKMA